LAGPLHVGDTHRLSETLRFLTRWVATLTVPVAITLITLRESLLALFGPTFVQASWVVLVHVAGNFLGGTFGLCGHVLTMSGRAGWLIKSQLAGLVLNLATCAVFIPRWGLPGAVLAFALGITTVNVLNVLGAWRLRGAHPFHRALAKPFVAGLAMGVAQLACVALSEGPLARIGVTLVAGAVTYALAYLVSGLEPEERTMVDKLRARLRGGPAADKSSGGS
jgi:O-antigen/teichoic acid export membrane protein